MKRSIPTSTTKQSQAAIIRLVESGIYEVGNLKRRRFYILVDGIVVSGSPPSQISASVLVKFLPAGAPYCCGEPTCYSSVFDETGLMDLGDHLRRKMNLQQTVTVDLNVRAEYFDGIVFTDVAQC